jgi:oligopeptidase B
MTDASAPPAAPQRPHQTSHHGRTISDPWAWLRDPGYPDVTDPDILAYLDAENAWFEAAMAPRGPLIDRLFEEMKARIVEDDRSVPQKDGDHLYWRAFEMGAQYRKWYRRRIDAPADGSADQLILDEPALAKGKAFFRLGAVTVSRCGRYLAWSTDSDGSERYTIRFRDLEAGETLPDAVPGASGQWGEESVEGTIGNILFTADAAHLLYGLVDENWRCRTIKAHRIGTPASEDRVLFHEEQDGFTCGVALSAAENLIFIATGDHETSEVWMIPADDPFAPPRLVSARQAGREYDVDEHDGWLYIRTNDIHPNFRLARARVETPDQWEEVLPPSDRFYLTDVSLFKSFYVTEGREDGLDQIEIRDYATNSPRRIPFPEASYVAGLDDNPEYDVDTLRISYESMVAPETIFDLDLASGERTVLKVQEVPSGYDGSRYRTERLTVPARDGTSVPVSIVYPADFPMDGSRPLHLYGYGAYGIAIEPGFSTSRLSLLDRGFAYAIAHIRGGDDLGQQWYLDGKREKRTNSFNDFVDVARGLIERGYTSAGRITISGGSAGGELMGAVLNDAPDLWGAAVAHVPFVDVLNTMLDASLPLTPGEWPEWGNPIEDAAAFDLIASYSPYDNVRAQPYPPLMVTAGLNDPRVTYWEPAKWVAKLRATKTDANVLLLKTNMGAGHGGKSGRWESLRETAEEFAFLLWQMGVEA